MYTFLQFGGNPVSMAVAEATLCVIEDEHLQEHAAEVGEFMLTGLKALKAKYPQVVGDVRWVWIHYAQVLQWCLLCVWHTLGGSLH